MAVTYSVYDRHTDLPVIIGGTAKECAAAMGLTVDSFYSTYSRRESSQKWEIFRDEELTEDEEI